MSFSFKDQVALITGAASGMGLATANAFAAAGASVVMADISEEAVKAAAAALNDAGYKALGIRCDVANIDEVKAMVDQAVATFGRIDVAFNNAGVQSPVAETALADPEDYDFVMDVNLRGIWNCMKYELIQMKKQGSGAIVNNSSLGGLVGIAERGIYHASKHGVVGLTKSAGLEYAPQNIRVNAICPGIIETPMVSGMLESQPEAMAELMKDVPIKRLGRAEEIADAVLWLCSPASSFVIGHALPVDGGYTVR
ncbi:oxidoreductase [Rouxiella silvae]|jgi:NAD(P)-dependent dehydrogenase (short-subunit alcohol dehydrogenase family)|uniref:Oxidoreductase n=1 Tax=Rouxiella silvae TaxID=1646373 RepID=A0ABX3TXZ8_9GAMM|nr:MULTISPECIES: glucose 1-dehydrogenase [Yersiniaceae]ORJ19969.1 oxidoreductase [Rouxiella silvae]HEN3577005.1 SDR family oxidoreductase [Yersinia enterocolitica]HEN3644054.1 SDR family oxidoreductase [Yersinia enterocolitica]HEN3668809.1 SDR family oxidoreductase [Yersinia enterocolitica]